MQQIGSGGESGGLVIRAMREGAGLSQAELAARLGCSESYISRLESGERQGGKFFLTHLAATLAELAEQAS